MGLSFSHLILVLVIVFVLFGAGKLPQMMGDLAKGLKAFKKGLHDEEVTAEEGKKSADAGAVEKKERL